MKIFLSLSERICLTKAQPVPINAIVMNNSAPFSLHKVKKSDLYKFTVNTTAQ